MNDKQSKSHYAAKVSDEIKQADNEQQANLKLEFDTLTNSIDMFNKMK